MNTILKHPTKEADETFKKYKDHWRLMDTDAKYLEIGDPNGPSEEWNIVFTTRHVIDGKKVSIVSFGDELGEHGECILPSMPLMDTWRVASLPGGREYYKEKYPDWYLFVLRNLPHEYGQTSKLRVFRRMEQWNISFDDEIGKQRILKDVEDAHARLYIKED